MEIKQLRSFAAIVNYRNFSRAAEKLNISQASVSTHLLQLEKELGNKLLHRTTKSIEVTDTGWAVYKYATQILELEGCIHEVCTLQARRIVRIGASTIPAAYILPEVLRQYAALFSNDHFKVSQCESKDVVEGVLDGRFDVGLIGHLVQKPGLRYVPLYPNPMVLITPATERYQKMQRQGASVEQLLQEPIILREQGNRKNVDDFLEKMGIEEGELKIAARVNDQETVKNMVAGGLGVSFLSEVAARDFIQSRRVLKFDLTAYREADQIYLVCPEDCNSRDNAWNFIDYLICLQPQQV